MDIWVISMAIVNRAAMNMWVHVFFQGKFCLDICPRVGLLGHMVVLGTSILFSIVVVPIYIPTKSVGGCSFLSLLPGKCLLISQDPNPVSLWKSFLTFWLSLCSNSAGLVSWFLVRTPLYLFFIPRCTHIANVLLSEGAGN